MAFSPLRFHLLGLAHLPVSRTYMACAFTQKIEKLSRMLLDLGHEVYLYGSEGSTAPCTEFIQTHTIDDIRDAWGCGDNRFAIGYDWYNGGFRHDFNGPKTKCTLKYYDNCIKEINERKRPDDFLLITQGEYQRSIASAVNLWLTVEPGVGYRGSFARFKAFESSYLQNFTYGSRYPFQSIDGNYYDRVIPNYFDPNDFPYCPKEEREGFYLFMGRINERKGVFTAIKTANAIGADLIIAGQQGDANINNASDHVKLWGYAGVEDRKYLMSRAQAIFVPTLYLEAFGGVHVEAMLCGTPAITTDFGVFPETVINGVNGYRCHMLNDFVEAAKAAPALDNKVIHEMAVSRFSMTKVAKHYEKWFNELHLLYRSAHEDDVLAWHYLGD